MTARRYTCELLSREHDLRAFDSGHDSLDLWLRQSARDSDGRDLTRTFVWHSGDLVAAAYYTLAPYFIEREGLARKQARGLPSRVPCYLLARLALDRKLHGAGLGRSLLASALERAAMGSKSLGGRFVIVDAIDEAAGAFYEHHGFVPVPGHHGRRLLPLKPVRQRLGIAEDA